MVTKLKYRLDIPNKPTLDIKDKTPTPLSTDSDMGDIDLTECRRCRDDNELWPCFGCSDLYCVDCLGGEMQVIDQVPPDPEKWFCTPSCKAIYHWRLLYAHAFTMGKLYLYVKRSKERRYWVNTLMPIIFGAAHDPDQHPVWNYLYQERIALLIRFLPLLTENVNR